MGSVSVAQGVFNVELGGAGSEFPPNLFANDNLYLGITVGNDDEMSPRTRFSSVPFAQRAGAAAAAQPDYRGYGLPEASNEALPNVIVLRGDPSTSGAVRYFARMRFMATNFRVSVNGTDTFFPRIFMQANVTTDAAGNAIAIGNYIEGYGAEFDPSDFTANIEQSQYDLSSLAKTVTEDDKIERWKCNPHTSDNTGFVGCVVRTLESATGQVISVRTRTRIYSLLARPLVLNGLTFNDVRFEIRDGTASRWRAKGIGTVSFGTSGDIIFYRVNGTTGGSLEGTPFAPGEPLHGLFFSVE